jgi:ABC-type transport system involved in multi-copper enzyme maturation permease subunit
MKKEIILFFIFVIAVCFICGCVNQSLPSISKSDDDVYIENLENFFIQYNESMNRIVNSQDSATLKTYKNAADMKILSKTYYDRIVPLKVSSKLELSKNSFLQYLTEMGIVSDLQMNAPSTFSINPEEQKHSCSAGMFLIKTFDSELCPVLTEKKSNLLPLCNMNEVHPC